MGLFAGKNNAGLAAAAVAYSVLDGQVVVRGDVETDGALRVDGRLEGSILRADLVVLATGATVVGDIHAREVIIGGAVTGNVTASGRVELQSSGAVSGDVQAGAVMIHEGGIINGRMAIDPVGQHGASGRPAKAQQPRLSAVQGQGR
jgi:cytoskeletal protein CcmA (bactofilin family)